MTLGFQMFAMFGVTGFPVLCLRIWRSGNLKLWIIMVFGIMCFLKVYGILVLFGKDERDRSIFLQNGNSVLMFGRYRAQDCRLGLVHESATFRLWYVHDTVDEVPVALKVMRQAEHLRAELVGRQGLSQDCVLGAIRFHVPAGESDEWGGMTTELQPFLFPPKQILTELSEEPSDPDADGNATYVLALPWAQSSLDFVISNERIAGNKVREIQEVLYAVVSGLSHMHEHGVLHGDIKPKVKPELQNSCLLTWLSAEDREM